MRSKVHKLESKKTQGDKENKSLKRKTRKIKKANDEAMRRGK